MDELTTAQPEIDWPKLLRTLADGIEAGWVQHQGWVIGSMATTDHPELAVQLELSATIERARFEEAYGIA